MDLLSCLTLVLLSSTSHMTSCSTLGTSAVVLRLVNQRLLLNCEDPRHDHHFNWVHRVRYLGEVIFTDSMKDGCSYWDISHWFADSHSEALT